MALIFVSYRRDDTQSATGRLCDKLQTHFGADHVFHDIESIEPGENFKVAIASKIADSAILLVMIGRHWLDAAGPDGRPRLFDPSDYVCLEIATALARELPIIPVLVEGAAVPSASVLPPSIAALTTRQAHEITEQRWQYDTDRLVRQLETFIPPERASLDDDQSTLGRTLLRAVAGWPADFVQLLLHPRRQLVALLKQPNFVLPAAVFFALSHFAAAWLFVQEDVVASVPMFVLQGVPVGTLILLLVVIPLHIMARTVRAPSHATSTMVILAYIQSVMMVLTATGIMFVWTGLALSNPDFGPDLRSAAYANLPAAARITRATEVFERSMGGPFLAVLAFAMVTWLFAAGWLLVAIGAFRDVWRISRPRALVVLILTAGMISVAGAFVIFAAML